MSGVLVSVASEGTAELALSERMIESAGEVRGRSAVRILLGLGNSAVLFLTAQRVPHQHRITTGEVCG